MRQYFWVLWREYLLPVVLVFVVVGTVLLIHYDKPELVPQFWVSVIVLYVSYWGLVFTHEKLRLDLFEKRFIIYDHVLDYCSILSELGTLEESPETERAAEIEKAIKAAHESFRGGGFHRAKALFGSDIERLFNEMNESFAIIVSEGHKRSRGQTYNAERYWKHVKLTVDQARQLPDHFRSYVYFGDYKTAVGKSGLTQNAEKTVR